MLYRVVAILFIIGIKQGEIKGVVILSNISSTTDLTWFSEVSGCNSLNRS